MRLSFSLLAGMAVVPMLVGAGLAVELSGYTPDLDGNDRKGQYLYRKYCRESCHSGENGKERSPMDLTMAEWKSIAEKAASLPCAKDWNEAMTEKDLNDIFTYLHSGAKDSPTPTK